MTKMIRRMMPEYGPWKDMKRRVFSPNNNRRKNYDAKGIGIHPDFASSFFCFLEEIGPRPNDGQRWSIGRIDNNGDYTYGNIRWETLDQQARNHSLQSNNTSGLCGVGLEYYKGVPYAWVARWKNHEGKFRTKNFLISRYGDAEAKLLAKAHRDHEIKELEKFGIFYAESHGSPTSSSKRAEN